MTETKLRSVVLRDTRDSSGTRHLEARFDDGGDLLLSGQDLGDGVEEYFGAGLREYEWCWTVRAADLPRLEAALGGADDVIGALGERFSGDAAAGLGAFLKENGIPYETWSRVGD